VGVIEYKDFNRSYTWPNNQSQSIMAKLDRVLDLVNWDIKYPLFRIDVLPRGVSDHSPIKITFGMQSQSKEPIFHFENGGLK
jgi:hypothetical protein